MEESLEQPEQPPPSISIQGEGAEHHIWLEEHVHSALTFLRMNQSEVTILIVDDKTMSDLHAKHSGIAGTTDVLTFDHGGEANQIHADIAVCIGVAARESKTRDHSVQQELLLYVVHGLLHCVGFDDHDDDSHSKIHAEEDRVLNAIGVGSVWSDNS
jgi:probable rRNA maturation factor